MQAKAMRNYHLHNPSDDSPPALPWPTDPPETIWRLPDVTPNRAKTTMQAPAGPPLRDPSQQATHPFFQPPVPPVPTPPVPQKRARRRRSTPAPSPQTGQNGRQNSIFEPPAPALTLPTNPASAPLDPPPARAKHPHHPPFCHTHIPSPKHTHSFKKARTSNSLSATTTRATGSGVRARSSTASRTRAQTVGCR